MFMSSRLFVCPEPVEASHMIEIGCPGALALATGQWARADIRTGVVMPLRDVFLHAINSSIDRIADMDIAGTEDIDEDEDAAQRP